MDNQYTEAQKIFAEVERRNFRYPELAKIQFYPIDPKDRTKKLRLRGKVVETKAGHCFIESATYPTFRCNSSKYNGLIMRLGLSVEFSPCFAAQGAFAIDPVEILSMV